MKLQSRLISIAFFIISISAGPARAEDSAPVKSVKLFVQILKDKNFDQLIQCLYIPESEKMPGLTAGQKEHMLQEFSAALGYLLNGEIISSKETDDIAVVTACKILPDKRQSPELKPIFLLNVDNNWKISPLISEPFPVQNISEDQFGKQEKTLKEWYRNQADTHSSKLCPEIKITNEQLPFQKDIVLKPGECFIVVFPNGNKLAVWCNGAGPLQLPGEDSDLDLGYGEQPFIRPEISWIPQPDGSRVSGPYKSYIRSGSVVTWSGGPGHEYNLFISDVYHVVLLEKGDKNGTLPVSLSVRLATKEEQVRPENEVEHLVGLLQQTDPRGKISAVQKLQEELMLGSTFAVPKWQYILEKIKPLVDDPDPGVKKEAAKTLRVLGDAGSIMKVIAPVPEKEFLKADEALALGQFAMRSKSQPDKERIYEHVKSFFSSDNPELRAFAVSFFTWSDISPEVKEQLIKAQNDSSPIVRKASILAMEKIYERNDIPKHRIPMLEDESPDVVTAVMESSTGFGTEEELPTDTVKKFLANDNKGIRLAAINAIQFKDNRESEALLLPLTHDPDKDIRVAATCALYGEKSKATFQRFLELLQDPDPLVRRRALEGFYLDDYIDAIPHIEAFMETEKDKGLLDAANEALEKLKRLKAKQGKH